MAVSAFVCGSASADSVSTLVVPVTANVPRTDPTNGATLILLFGSSIISDPFDAFDDAGAEDDYSFCLFDDGLNHYGVTGQYPGMGLIANDLVGGTNSITVDFDTTLGFAYVVAVAVTGVALTTSGTAPLFDPTMPGSFCESFFQHTDYPFGTGLDTALGVSWDYTGGAGAVHIDAPSGATDGGWGWVAGDLAFYPIANANGASSFAGWTWSDGSITDFFQFEGVDGGGFYHAFALGTAPITPGVAGPSLAGAWGGGQVGVGVGEGPGFVGGGGPSCSTPPPTGYPVFGHQIRVPD